MKEKYQYTAIEGRIRAAIVNMPYGGLQRLHNAACKVGMAFGCHVPVTLESIANYLEAMREVLERVSEENAQDAKELTRLQNDVAAVRRLFGGGK